MRCLLSLLWYGEPEKQQAVRSRLREPAVFQNILFTSMQAGHYVFNIGAKVTLLAQELLRLPPGAREEEKVYLKPI